MAKRAPAPAGHEEEPKEEEWSCHQEEESQEMVVGRGGARSRKRSDGHALTQAKVEGGARGCVAELGGNYSLVADIHTC